MKKSILSPEAVLRNAFVCLLLCLAFTQTGNPAIAGEDAVPFTIFRKYPTALDRTRPWVHPQLADPRNNHIALSVQEGDIVRMALYAPEEPIMRISRYDFINDSGRDLTGLPAGKPRRALNNDWEAFLFGDDILLSPYVRPSRHIGSREWPNRMWWRHIYGNYYVVTVYRDNSVVFEHLITELNGHDLRPFLGASVEEPGKFSFLASFGGADMFFLPTPNETLPEIVPMYLTPVEEQDLPPDFPKGLVRWIP